LRLQDAGNPLQAPKARPVPLEHKARRDLQDLQDLPDQLVLRGRKDPLVQPDLLVQRETPDRRRLCVS
jgi:hypothetical protein